jgi:site-specific DNA recombinase
MLVQKLTDNRKTLLGDLIRQVEAMQNRTSDNIDVIRRIDKKIADLAAQNLVIARLHTNGVINSAEFSAQSSEINNKISTLRTKRRKKLSDDENDAWFDTLNSLNEILEAYDPSNNFDEELFEKIVVGITVNSNADLTFKLIGDIELTEEIPLKGRCRRRENS